MTKLTTERLEELANATTPSVKYVGREIIAMARQILAYEQAAKNPVAWVATDSEDFPEYNSHNEFSADCGAGTPLYAAPVLPKQPELVENLKKVMNSWLAMEPKLAFQPEFTDVMMLLDAEAAPAQPVIPEGLLQAINRLLDNDGSRGCFDALEQHRAKTELERLLAAAQPVSEPYKLKDAVEDIRNSGVEIDADKIKAERDTLNSPVIPDGWKLVPIEPTAAMFHAFNDCDYGRKSMRERYIQMIEAAPAQEQK